MRRIGRPKFPILSALAMILLVAQLALAAGHLHDAAAPAGPAAALSAGHSDPDDRPDEHGQPDCALCWVEAAGAKLVLPAPAEPAPLRIEAAAPPAPSEAEPAGSAAASAFRSRAPPALRTISQS